MTGGRLSALARSAALFRKTDGRPAPLAEAAVLVVVILFFARIHAAVGTDAAVATANALALQSVERALHVDIALAANQWLTGNPGFIQPAVYYYRLYYLAIIGALVWVYLRRPAVYLKVRRTLVAMALLVLPVYWAVPMSPPRFALPGIVDIIAEHDILGGAASRAAGTSYSAMPSMHVGWSLWCGYAVWIALRGTHPRLALLAWVFPLGMVGVVLVTGNHYVLDIAGSFLLLGASIGVVWAWERLSERVIRPRPGVP
ncbi:phosphatase PAP2 family protein [Nonomuraea sp. NBC_01738]|uniref:phosphatase PAP2 family protein n=1 Tax=Nonomuraea sp. NBC_01738 TaxID=2976003 RepID=UPI002E151AE5|nr:phosphatase PAP2 family protein [Nonomuraea sp. NBC_01738]